MWIRPRGTSAASSTGAGIGGAEHIVYTPATTDRYGVTLVNTAGSGSYRPYMDKSPLPRLGVDQQR